MKSLTENLSLSLQELFAVLVPGATTYFFLSMLWWNDAPKLKNIPDYLEGALSQGIALFGGAYFLGYAMFVWSSNLDCIYDRIKRRVLNLDQKGVKDQKEKKDEAIKEGDVKRPTSKIINFLFPNIWDTHVMIGIVKEFKNKKIGQAFDGDKHQIINAYQFAFRWLMKEKPEMFEEAERYMATAKFFRNMFWVWLLGATTWGVKAACGQKLWLILFVLLSVVSFFTYLNRWRKAHHIAFKNLIILEAENMLKMEEGKK